MYLLESFKHAQNLPPDKTDTNGYQQIKYREAVYMKQKTDAKGLDFLPCARTHSIDSLCA